MPSIERPQSTMGRRRFLQSAAAGSAGIASLRLTSLNARAQEATPTTNEGLANASAAQVQRATDLLPDYVQHVMDESGVPGVTTAVVFQNELVGAAGYGVRSVETGEPVEPGTVFQIASCSKPISSTVVAGAVSDGDAAWDSRLMDLDPAFAMYVPWVTSQVTVEDMFSHRSGLPDHAGDLLEDMGYDRAEVLHRLQYMPPLTSFRSGYAYTNFGLTAGANAVTTSLGIEWADYAQQRLFDPLGMTNSSYRFADFEAAENRALTHMEVSEGVWEPGPPRQPDPQAPAGGVSSNVEDLSKWLILQLAEGEYNGQQIIGRDALNRTHLPHMVSRIPDDPTVQRAGFYGLGWNVSYDSEALVQLGHSGAFALGAATSVYMIPQSSLGIVVLTNGSPIGIPEAIALTFLDYVAYGEAPQDYFAGIQPIMRAAVAPNYGDELANAEAGGAPAKDPSAYEGIYDNVYFGPLQIASEGDGLTMSYGPDALMFDLEHVSNDVFSYQPIGENAGPVSAITFTIGPDGIAESVVVENLDVDDIGTFIRSDSAS